ncbi:hypothetical protein GW17_00005578 [Ensete ventricosum]|nr:hypothetical protein GW17_00005578 [Ensete ventricosum]
MATNTPSSVYKPSFGRYATPHTCMVSSITKRPRFALSTQSDQALSVEHLIGSDKALPGGAFRLVDLRVRVGCNSGPTTTTGITTANTIPLSFAASHTALSVITLL